MAGVLGPGDQPLPLELGLVLGLVLSRDGDAARYLIVLDDQPLGAGAVGTVLVLRDDFPDLLRTVGLPDVRAGLAGGTAIADGVVAVQKFAHDAYAAEHRLAGAGAGAYETFTGERFLLTADATTAE